MSVGLASIDEDVWCKLTSATKVRDHDLRYVSLASLSKNQVPVSRLLVLRGLHVTDRTLLFHTDIMSDKWAELSTHPKASILGFSSDVGEQFRFEGRVELFSHTSNIHQAEWDKLSTWSQNTYCGGPPGDEANAPSLDPNKDVEPPSDEQLAKGCSRFGVIKFKAERLDWFQLKRSDNRRAEFFYDTSGRIEKASWINP